MSETYLREWGTTVGGGELSYPTGIAYDAGKVYVADRGHSRVIVFNADGTYVTQWGTNGPGNGRFNRIVDLTVTPDYVYTLEDGDQTGYGNHRVQYFTHEGLYVGQWGYRTDWNNWTLGSLNGPEGIHAAYGAIYVADTGHKRVQWFTPTGDYIESYQNNDEFYYNLRGMSHDETVLYLARMSGWIDIFNDSTLTRIGAASFADQHPFAVCWYRGELYADTPYSTAPFSPISLFAVDGTWLRGIGVGGSGTGKVQTVRGLAVGNDELFVTDFDQHKILVYSLSYIPEIMVL